MKRSTIAKLVALAMRLDAKGFTKEAQSLDRIINPEAPSASDLFEGPLGDQGFSERAPWEARNQEMVDQFGHGWDLDDPNSPWGWSVSVDYIGDGVGMREVDSGKAATLQEAVEQLHEHGQGLEMLFTYDQIASDIVNSATTEFIWTTKDPQEPDATYMLGVAR